MTKTDLAHLGLLTLVGNVYNSARNRRINPADHDDAVALAFRALGRFPLSAAWHKDVIARCDRMRDIHDRSAARRTVAVQ